MNRTILIMLMFAAIVFAGEKQDQAKMDMTGKGHVMIQVPTVQCESCVETITTALDKVDGIKSVHIDLDKKIAHINYDDKKIKVEDIRNAIAATGYDADDVKRDEKAHHALPMCCQSQR